MRQRLTPAEINVMRQHLRTYQSGINYKGWDDYKVRINEELLDKWARVLVICRQNGFLLPYATHSEIIWSQVLDRGYRGSGDPCFLCTNTTVNNSCRGRWTGKDFVPCWMLNPAEGQQ